MRTKHLLLVLALLLSASFVSANEDSRPEKHPRISGVIHDVIVDGDNVVIHLYREPYEVLTVKWTRVHTSDDVELYAGDLRDQDNVEIVGDFDPEGRVFTVRRIQLTGRVEHRSF
jgi:hypothetical protein